MAERVSELLRQSVAHLQAEVPDSYRFMLDTLGPLKVAIQVDGDAFHVSGGSRLAVFDGADDTAGATIATSRTAILDVLDARIGLRAAVEGGSVSVRGSIDNILRAHDTILAFVHAAVRAPSQPDLLDALRAGVQ